ncbi:hypothetical protein BDV98DRAFT_507092 [Pterulicium gracile]|uniref:LAG1-DNAbind-domain-containing protein n=1 Tax=Pterulicium gracile TaxID=1884261 RepID=A0A5C3QIK8_9AGAR|nr:hypothetical protein BDV98DRAFT_507092 [Pterula gracilis]
MSLDFSSNHSNLYNSNDQEYQTFGTNDQPQDTNNAQDHSNYDLFSNPEGPFTRYRSNTMPSTSSSSHHYSMNTDAPVYSQSSFHDSSNSSTSFASAQYDMMTSTYSSGKVSPITPSDNGAIHYSQLPKDFSPSSPYRDILSERRLPSYNSDYQDDFNGLTFSPPLANYASERARYPDARYQAPSSQASATDLLRGVAPHATHSFRPDPTSTYDTISQYMDTSPHSEIPLRMPTVDETLARMKLQQGSSSTIGSTDLPTFIRPFLEQYIRTPNRLAFGERSVIVMSSKVAQKSYGTEKRFLCPPPTAIMIGNSWWSEASRRGEEPRLCAPRVTVSISGEPSPPESSVDWTGSTGKTFDASEPPSGTTYTGRCVGKQLFISDVDEKKKKVEALVKIAAPTFEDEPERVIGVFPSRPIKVISKPSKKRQSAKNLELCINHGSTISLFHRLRSQTVSTKYLCVSGSGSSFKGSDGAPLMGLDHRCRSNTPSFIARTSSWDPFVIYIVDVNKLPGVHEAPPPPPQADYPSPPPNAIPFTSNGSPIPVYYNQTVVLQCLISGVVSPVLVIRKVDHQTTVVGGGLQEGAKGVASHFCAPGEVCGDPVSQLHKIAFEVFELGKTAPMPGTTGQTGSFLSCMGEKVNTYRPIDGRSWNTSTTAPNGNGNGNGAQSPPAMPSSPVQSNGSDYFMGNPPGSAPSSPTMPGEFLSNDGGRVRKKRSSSSAGIATKPVSTKGRRRGSVCDASSTGGRRGSASDPGAPVSGSLWQVDIGETSVWTIVGTDQIRYNFYVPPVLFDQQHSLHTHGQTASFPIPSKAVTPFPAIVKYLPPDRASEAPKSNCAHSRSAVLGKPNPHAAKMLTVYGENFSKADPVHVFFGSEPSPFVEVRCTEVLGCMPPESQLANGGGVGGGGGKQPRRPMVIVREDGVIFPSGVMYP